MSVDITYKIIEQDSRHQDPKILFSQKNESRCYPDWSMKFNVVGRMEQAKHSSGCWGCYNIVHSQCGRYFHGSVVPQC